MGITQVFDKYYETDAGAPPQIGSIFWVPTPEVAEVPRLLEVHRSTPEEHEITDFEFVEIADRHFKPNSRLPIKRLNLEDTQELLVTRAKKRPCVILARAHITPDGIAAIADKEQLRQAKHLQKPIHLVAPMYGCATYAESRSFGPILTARVKALSYPHLFYMSPLNSKDAGRDPGSILRLDHTFPTHLGRGSETAGLKVIDEVMEIILGQLQIVCGLPPSEILVAVKELVKECLPEGLE